MQESIPAVAVPPGQPPEIFIFRFRGTTDYPPQATRNYKFPASGQRKSNLINVPTIQCMTETQLLPGWKF